MRNPTRLTICASMTLAALTLGGDAAHADDTPWTVVSQAPAADTASPQPTFPAGFQTHITPTATVTATATTVVPSTDSRDFSTGGAAKPAVTAESSTVDDSASQQMSKEPVPAAPTYARKRATSRQAPTVRRYRVRAAVPSAPAVRRSVSVSRGRRHIVQAGETLSGLFPNSWQDIARRNGIDNPDMIFIGQEIDY